ncbi:MAG: hypothetical protein Unbinned5081contig1000_37 [Prokaryotic dsDNA virus sp.]|nr:MAG: hypothetical protein Unbinned5081contig1000_37 [Prokaryotic dsDNA virus sp.]|tara:strand:- start:10555 stop:10833 length:279 start_codon:yes stop_codon:yes gene_type:complete
MASKVNKRFLSRDPDEYGSVAWDVTKEFRYNGKQKRVPFFDANLRLSDCYRTITLDFCFGNSKRRKARIKKLATLIAELEKMKKAMEEADLG